MPGLTPATTPGGSPGAAGPTGAASGGAGHSPAAAAGSAGAPSGAAPGSGGAPAITGSRLIPANAQGVTASQILIGVNLAKPGSGTAAATQFGAKGISGADDTPTVKSIISYINAHGGVAGRTLAAVFAYTDVTAGSFDQQAQAACASFTSDHQVFAVVQQINDGSAVLPACLAQHHVALFDEGNSAFYDSQSIGQWAPYYYSPGRMTLDRMSAQITGLAQQGYFDKGSRVGVALYDSPSYQRALSHVIRPALAAVGFPPTDVYQFSLPSSAAGVSDTAAQASNAVLKFRSEGIDHVIFVASLGALPFLFLPESESQGYRPRYGFSSSDLPDFQRQNAPATQLARSIAVGWNRSADMGALQTWNDTPASRQCQAAVRASGVTDLTVAYGVSCDPYFLLQAALANAGEVSGAGLRAAMDRLGASFQMVGPPATSFGPGLFDGIAGYRDLPFNAGCDCYRYVGGALSL